MRNFAKNYTAHCMRNFIFNAMPKPWKIPPDLASKASYNRLVEMLSLINKFNHSTSFYIRNTYEKKIIVDSPLSTILCGYPKELVDKEGYAFYERILDKKEFARLTKIFEETHRILHKFSASKRKHLMSSYGLTVKTANQEELFLHNESVPHMLCGNGNLLLCLCSVKVSTHEEKDSATITNTQTGEHFVFHNDKYVLSDKLAITHEDLIFLKMLCDDFTNEEIMSRLGVDERSFRRKRQRLFVKLNSTHATAAIHKAHLRGII